jgi:hypothetical protein
MSQSRRGRRPRVEALEERATPSTPPTVHVLTITPPPPSAAPIREALVPLSACHAIGHEGKADGIVTCSI